MLWTPIIAITKLTELLKAPLSVAVYSAIALLCTERASCIRFACLLVMHWL